VGILLVIFLRPKKRVGGIFLGFFSENLGNFSSFWGKKSPKS
jgi:hypothetical protein